MKNKLAAILMAALVASCTLAGCGSSANDTAQSAAANESATVASADVSAEEKAALEVFFILGGVILYKPAGLFIKKMRILLAPNHEMWLNVQ